MHKLFLFVLINCVLLISRDSQAEPAKKRFPGDIEYQKDVVEATQLYRKGNYQKSITLLMKLHQLFPEDPLVLQFRADCYLADDEPEKASDDWTSFLKLTKVKKDHNKLKLAFYSRGVCYFNMLNFKKSVNDFDQLVELDEEREPHLWQRGISHYYAKMYTKGRQQFEIHQKVNGNDVENAVWHFLCIAKEKGIKAAQKNLIPIKNDSRLPLMKAHALFAGKATVDDVLKRATEELPEDKQQAEKKLKRQRFYAHLYIGLYYEAHAKPKLAYKHLKLAATKYFIDGYMGDVAKVHVKVYDKKKK